MLTLLVIYLLEGGCHLIGYIAKFNKILLYCFVGLLLISVAVVGIFLVNFVTLNFAIVSYIFTAITGRNKPKLTHTGCVIHPTWG